MVLGKLPVPGRPTILIIVGQGPTVLAVDAGGGCLDIFSPVYHFSFHTPSLWETARYRLKYFLKGPLSPTQPTNQNQENMFLTSIKPCSLLVKICANLSVEASRIYKIPFFFVFFLFCFCFFFFFFFFFFFLFFGVFLGFFAVE